MNQLAVEVLEALLNGDERFEAIFCEVNEIAYINLNMSQQPLYKAIESFPAGGKYAAVNVAESVIELIQQGYIECYKRESSKSYVLIQPSLTLLKEERFYAAWLKITEQGKKAVTL